MDGKISIRADQARPGSVLANDVRDRSGRLLLSAGLPLREKHVRVLKTWGVTEIFIWIEKESFLYQNDLIGVSASNESKTAITKSALNQAKVIMEIAFTHAEKQNPVMNILFEIATERLARKLVTKGSP
ncbi:hypothetical protein CKO35_12900 [Ectothiorhodospira shaposhnikovii]|uniref:hypothetical protein n=1 Tax=Ectothiorhodospira shaposhnikovii TaxID=1054 RepID=UPI0019063490|nr:hypothetical protein [Ectothiorhodospira shaposhnikovii]MBK1674185.1 hypothetical protein [Ectothiorhodospira shaposhnikovii]